MLQFALMGEKIQPELLDVRQLPEFVNGITRLCVNWHNEFDDLRGHKPSYHNRFHIKSALKSAWMLTNAASHSDKQEDPFNLIDQLDRWNRFQQANDREPVSMDEFRHLTQFAFACHDLGNIAETILAHSSFTKKEKEKYIELVTHLINETSYEFNSPGERPLFALFMRIAYQIGSNYLSEKTQEEISNGLKQEFLEEWGEEKSYPRDFISIRFPLLVPDETMRRQIQKNLGVNT